MSVDRYSAAYAEVHTTACDARNAARKNLGSRLMLRNSALSLAAVGAYLDTYSIEQMLALHNILDHDGFDEYPSDW